MAGKGQKLWRAIVDTPFADPLAATNLGLGIVVLLLADAKIKLLRRVALSNTPSADGALRLSAKPFHEISIPLDYKQNLIIQAITTGEPQQTADWQHLFAPDLSPREARLNQAGAGVECSAIYPFKGRKRAGALIFSFYEPPEGITPTHRVFMQTYTDAVGQCLNG